MTKKPLVDAAGEVRELTVADIRAMRPAEAALPADTLAILPKRRAGQRGPQKSPTKKQITIRLDAEIVQRAKASGPGWQSRVNAALKRAFGA